MRAMILFAAAVLSGCVTAPHNITPQFVTGASYRGMDCATLNSERDARQRMLATLDAEQTKAHTMDVVWVTLGTFIVWPAYFGLMATEDHEAEISRLRGEASALTDALTAGDCT